VAKVKIKGLDQLEKKLRALPEVIDRAARRTIHEETNEAAQDLRRGAPVLSGDLRRSIQAEIAKKGLAGIAAVTAKHATYVIHGTSKQDANDFVTPVIARVRRRFPDRLVAEVKAELRKVT